MQQPGSWHARTSQCSPRGSTSMKWHWSMTRRRVVQVVRETWYLLQSNTICSGTALLTETIRRKGVEVVDLVRGAVVAAVADVKHKRKVRRMWQCDIPRMQPRARCSQVPVTPRKPRPPRWKMARALHNGARGWPLRTRHNRGGNICEPCHSSARMPRSSARGLGFSDQIERGGPA